MGKQASQGNTSENSRRNPHNAQRGEFSTLNRMLLGQLAEPPETALSVPLQQSVTNLQGGMPNLLQQFGLGGSIADQLSGNPRTGGGAMLPGPNQSGLQSRAQLGLPDRDTYFPLKPTLDELGKAGAVPKIAQSHQGRQQRAKFDRLSADETRTPKQEKRLDRMKRRHPEWGTAQ